ncbi:hypothetical protein CJU90_1029 [Yarrowia sp. C11]|nr:hypothetical protein CKK34_2442 [Yarrowia sp. E02]KAG5373336.1 hypothetical protein CJU90_1029 [Yarrowia sp. C11]
MSAAQLDFYYDMDDDLGLSSHSSLHQASIHHHSSLQTSLSSLNHSSMVSSQLQQPTPASAYTDLYIYSNYPSGQVTSDARDNSARHFTPYSNSSSNASSTSVDCCSTSLGDSPRSTQLLTQPIPSCAAQVLTPTTSISSALTTPTSSLTSPPSSATYPMPSMPRKRSVEFISHEISNTSGAPLVLSQPPKRAHKRHVSDAGLVASSEPIYYYSNLVSPTESYDEYRYSSNNGFDHIQEEQHAVPMAHPVMWNPAYTVLPSQKTYHSRDRHNSDYGYDYSYDQRRTSESSETRHSESSATSEPVASGFINYTQRDGPKLMTGVAPSGAQKTKQKREAEARRREAERREKDKGYY